MIAKRLPLLCDRRCEDWEHEMDPHAVCIDAYRRRHHSKAVQKLLLEIINEELGRWERGPSGRLRRSDLLSFSML